MESEKKSSTLSDVGAWAMNVISSVGLIMANKQLMSTHGYAFSYATTLTGFHFTVTALVGLVSNATGYSVSKHVPVWELLWFSIVANMSITGMNFSLMLNSVGFYQFNGANVVSNRLCRRGSSRGRGRGNLPHCTHCGCTNHTPTCY
ncbi:UDP-rhamnose/UDP-galactose transporter 2 [Ancistrocladus abbreviatus]